MSMHLDKLQIKAFGSISFILHYFLSSCYLCLECPGKITKKCCLILLFLLIHDLNK